MKAKKINLDVKSAKAYAAYYGSFELLGGVFLHTANSLASDQKTWDCEDESKKVDFFINDWWIVTTDGKTYPVDDEDIADFL